MNLHRQQQAFARYIRNPGKHPGIEGIPSQRMALYRELFFNNILETLSNAFPVTKPLLGERQWRALCESFFAEHPCHTPYLSRLPGEFVTFIRNRSEPYPAWLAELAQWEWTELELFMAPDDHHETDTRPHGPLLDTVPRLSSLARLHTFRYPVHEIGPENPPGNAAEQPCHLLAWRKRDHSIGFMQLNPLSAQLLERLRNNRADSAYEILSGIADQRQDREATAILSGGCKILFDLYNKGIVDNGLTPLAKETPHE